MISAAGSDDQRAEWLPKLASGEATGSFGGFADGTSTLFCDLPTADVVVTFDGEGRCSRPPPRSSSSPSRRSTRPAPTAWSPTRPGERLPATSTGAATGSRSRSRPELTGIAQRALEMAVDYARERQQFGRPIGAYQAVGHRCAGMLLATEESRSLTYYAAWAADAEPESLPMAAAMAAARAADAGWQVPASALQVFGGIGFTWEHDLQFWLKRGRVAGRMLGTPRDHRERVADLSG